MLQVDRERVTNRRPRVYIARRAYRTEDGTRKACAVWWAIWCRDGGQFEQSLHTDSRREARRAARALAKQLQKGKLPPPPPPDPELSQLRDQYIEYQIGRGHAERTVAKYRVVINSLVRWAVTVNVTRAMAFDERRYWAFHKWLTDEEYPAKTRYDRLIIVKQFFKWAARNNLIPGNPISAAQLIRKPDPTPQPCFTPEQVSLLLRAADDEHRPVFAVMAYAGLRFGEVRDLEWSDVRLDESGGGTLVVRRGGSGETTKTGRSRIIPLHPALRDVLRAVPRRDARLVFVSRRPRLDPAKWYPLAERQTLLSLKRLCRRCGFAGSDTFKLHTLRHVFCSMCARSNVPFKYALVWLGHRKSDMLDHYFHTFDETAAAAMRTIAYPDVASDVTNAGDYSI